jgi:hypothetical protein
VCTYVQCVCWTKVTKGFPLINFFFEQTFSDKKEFQISYFDQNKQNQSELAERQALWAYVSNEADPTIFGFLGIFLRFCQALLKSMEEIPISL